MQTKSKRSLPMFLKMNRNRLVVGLISLLGVALRLYQLGTDSFWVDEIGVATAAQMPTIAEMLACARNHVMAMPLDYIVAWLFARVDTGEFFLRLPAAIWGSLSIPLSYAVFRRLSSDSVAVLTSLLLALSPLHVQYSQELRFYAALVFFYLLSIWVLIRAIEQPAVLRWVLFTVITGIGIFFHVYVLLATTFGAAWLWITHRTHPEYQRQRKYFLRSTAALLITFLFAILFFGSVYTYDIPLLLNEHSFLSLLGVSFGWIPYYVTGTYLPWVFGFLTLGFAIVAVAGSIAGNPTGRESVSIYAIVGQVTLITLLNLAKRYFIEPRQLLFLLPFMLFFTALGIQKTRGIIDRINEKKSMSYGSITLILLFFLTSIPALLNYYQGHKGMAKEISQVIGQAWQSGEIVLVIPDFEVSSYLYYSARIKNMPGVNRSMYGTNWPEFNQFVQQEANPIYLVTHYPVTEDEFRLLKTYSFEEFFVTPFSSRFTHSIWRRDPLIGSVQNPSIGE